MKYVKGQVSAFKGKKHSLESRKLIGATLKANRKTEHGFQRGIKNPNFGKILSELDKQKLREIAKKRITEGKWFNQYGGFKGGIKWRDIHSLSNSRYKNWRAEVFKRDKYKCKLASEKCNGQLEAHHILPWRDFVEERYNINNGITLCHFHHPRKRVEEQRLMQFFRELVEVKELPLAVHID